MTALQLKDGAAYWSVWGFVSGRQQKNKMNVTTYVQCHNSGQDHGLEQSSTIKAELVKPRLLSCFQPFLRYTVAVTSWHGTITKLVARSGGALSKLVTTAQSWTYCPAPRSYWQLGHSRPTWLISCIIKPMTATTCCVPNPNY